MQPTATVAAAPFDEEEARAAERKREADTALAAVAKKWASELSPAERRQPPATAQATSKKQTQADILIQLAHDFGTELYHAPDASTYADVLVDGHRETWPTGSTGFRQWLRHAYYRQTGGAPNAEAMTTAMGVIEACARYDGHEYPVHLRVAGHDECIYVDLCDATWGAVEISSAGWQIVDDPPVRFRRVRGMLPLAEPRPGGSVDDLAEFFPTRGDSFKLMVSWILASLRHVGPYPILALAGEQGTGKSTSAAMLRRLVDPNVAPLRAAPRDSHDLYIAANNSHVVALDNLSTISADIADSMCRLSTGGGFATRKLYTDSDETLFTGQRPQLLTSINDVASRSDVADRALFVTLDPISELERKGEHELWAAFDVALPGILGALFDAMAHGLHMAPSTRLDRLPRMADYALWIAACETSLWEAGQHMAAYDTNRRETVETVLGADPVADVLRKYMENRSTSCTTAADLLAQLNAIAPDHVKRDKTWPMTAGVLSGRLARLAPALRSSGINIERPGREKGTRRRQQIKISVTPTCQPKQ